MTEILQSIGLAFSHLFKSQKPLLKWVETVTPEKIFKPLTKAYLSPPEFLYFGPLLSKSQVSFIQEKIPKLNTEKMDAGLKDCIAFYAGYPFKPIPVEKMEKEDWIRAIIGMSGKDVKALDGKQEAGSGESKILMQKGRSGEERLRLLFSALSGATPTKDNILDVLYITQPRPDDCMLPYGHARLQPILNRWDLKFVEVEKTSVEREKLVGFLKEIGFEMEVGEGERVGLEEFLRVCESKPGILEAMGKRTEELFLK